MIEKKDFTPALQHYLSLGPHLAFVFLDAHYQKATLEVELQDLKKTGLLINQFSQTGGSKIKRSNGPKIRGSARSIRTSKVQGFEGSKSVSLCYLSFD